MLDENMMLAWRDQSVIWMKMFTYRQGAPALFKDSVIRERYVNAEKNVTLWTI